MNKITTWFVGMILVITTPLGHSSTCVWKTTDIIGLQFEGKKYRLDESAQYSLMRKMGDGPPTSNDASAMIGAIKGGSLEGISLPDQDTVIQRGTRMQPSIPFWKIRELHIPKGQKNSTCLKEPPGEPPLIIFRKDLTEAQIDRALSDAWAECGLPTPLPPCDYVVDTVKPQVECKTYEDCELKVKRGELHPAWNYECEHNKCVRYRPPVDVIKPPVCQKCDVPNVPVCPEGTRCKASGCCEVIDDKEKKCIADSVKGYRDRLAQCSDEQAKGTTSCVDASRRCAGLDTDLIPFDLKDCGEVVVDCGVDNPQWEGDKCRRKAYEKRQRELEKCRKVNLEGTVNLLTSERT